MVAITIKKPIYRKQPEEFLIKRRARFFFTRLLRIVQSVLFLALTCFVIWSVWFDKEKVVEQFVYSKTKQILLTAGFAIEKIEIYGNEKVSNNEVLTAMLRDELEDISKYPIVMLSLDQVEKNLAHINWIKEINITKKFPGTVIVHIQEREPAVLWQRNQEVWLSDREGNLINKNIGEYTHLPLIVGKNEKDDIREVFDILTSEQSLNNKVTSFTKVGERRWDVELKNGMLVKLPESNPIEAWHKLADFEKNKSILSKDIKYIDLRIEGQLVAGL